MTNKKKTLYSVSEVANELNVSTKTIYRRLRDQSLKAIKIGNRWKISKEELDRILSQGLSS